jgi:hypothetical protein
MIAAGLAQHALDGGADLRMPRQPSKPVVHSSHGAVTKLDHTTTLPFHCPVFHGQAIDCNGTDAFGTFLTKSLIAPVFTLRFARSGAACTDLSTSRVDKGKTPAGSATCTSLMGNHTAIARKRASQCLRVGEG